MNKKKVRARKQMMTKTNNSGYTATGQPTPLTVRFAELRKRALQTPMLKEAWQPDEVDVNRHCKAIDYSVNYLLGIVVLCVLTEKAFEKHFIWHVQAAMIAKKSGNYVKLDLLTTKDKAALEQARIMALGNAGNQDRITTKKTINATFTECPLSPADYLEMPMQFRQIAGM